MTRSGRGGGEAITKQALSDALDHGVPEGVSLRELTRAYQKAVLAPTLAKAPSNAAAARSLGISREGLYKVRERLGLPIDAAGEKPIREDWRERLESGA